MTAPAVPAPMNVTQIARHIAWIAEQYGESPLALDLSVAQGEERWKGTMAMDSPYEWPQGTSTLVWDTDVYPEAPSAFHTALRPSSGRAQPASSRRNGTSTWQEPSTLCKRHATPQMAQNERCCHQRQSSSIYL